MSVDHYDCSNCWENWVYEGYINSCENYWEMICSNCVDWDGYDYIDDCHLNEDGDILESKCPHCIKSKEILSKIKVWDEIDIIYNWISLQVEIKKIN